MKVLLLAISNKTMKKVYLLKINDIYLSDGSLDSGWTEGVFSTKAKAMKHLKEMAKEKEWEDYEDDYEIVETIIE